MKLIKGKKVRIIDISKFSKVSKELEYINIFMCDYCGKEATIIEIDGDTCRLDIDNKLHRWRKEYLKPYKKILKPKTRKLWVAKDEGTDAVYLYGNKPVLLESDGMWDNQNNDYICMGMNKDMAEKLFPKLTFENSPQRVNVSFELIK